MRRTGTEVEPALAALTAELHPKLVGLLALSTGDRHLAEDLAQETLIRLHLNWATVRTHPNPTAWASRVAVNLSTSWWRRRGAERRANERAEGRPPALVADPADVVAVRTAVAALARQQRTIIALRFYQGLSVRETAEVLGCPEGTVKSQTSTAVAALRRQLGDLDVPPAPPTDRTDPTEPTIPMETFHA